MKLKLLLKTLMNNKAIIFIVCICYAASIGAISYIYSFQKKNIEKSNPIITMAKFKENVNLEDASSLGKKFRDNNFNGLLYFSFDNYVCYYENKLPNGLKFGSDNEIFTGDRQLKLGSEVLVGDKTYTVIGYSLDGNDILNINEISPTENVFVAVYKDTGVVTQNIVDRLKSVYYENNILSETLIPQKTNIIIQITTNQFFILICFLIALSLITALAVNTYLTRARLRFAKVLLSLGSTNIFVMFLFLAEQLLLLLPMLFVGFGLYFCLFAFFKDILAVLSFLDILFISLSYVFLLEIATGGNYLLMTRSDKDV